MTSHLDSHRTTDIKLEMLSGVQTGNGIPHDQCYVPGIIGVGQRDFYIDQAHMVLDIFRFEVFFLTFQACWN